MEEKTITIFSTLGDKITAKKVKDKCEFCMYIFKPYKKMLHEIGVKYIKDEKKIILTKKQK